MRLVLRTLLALVGLAPATIAMASEADPSIWKAGLASVPITPEQPIWMAGYGSRTSPSEGVLHDIWAKALALEDPEGLRALLITLDLCGIDREFSLSIRERIGQQHDLPLDRIVLSCSHTHTGPVVGTNLLTMYPLDEEQSQRVDSYTELLGDTIVGLAREAFEDLKEAKLSWGQGETGFAVNRRNNNQQKAAKLRAELALQGPVDHDVPVLCIRSPEGEVRGIIFGYACHCTTLSINQFSGDYAGFAMMELEKSYPDAVAMFFAGCGADQNPLPRRTVALAEKYGHQLADAVTRTVEGRQRPVIGSFCSAYEEIDLAFAPLPDREHWEQEAKSETFAVANRARAMLARLDSGEGISETYPYPVQVWRLGQLTWLFLGGEVVVDYALRVKRNVGPETFVAAYSNDVMAYIPSLRVLQEGGYEGGGAMVYYGHPGPWAEDVEERIIESILRLLNQCNGQTP